MSANGARHRAVRERRIPGLAWLAVLVALALLIGVGLLLLGGNDTDEASEECPGPDASLAVSPELHEVLAEALQRAGCDQINVIEADSAAVSKQVLAGDGVPDAWIPDSSVWAERVADADPVPETLVESLGSSPVVLVAAGGAPPATWSEALGHAEWRMGDPLTSTAAAVPVVAASAESTEVETTQLVVPLAQAQAGRTGEMPSDAERLTRLAEEGVGVTSVSEQRQLAEAPTLAATVPDAGTFFLDYPVLVTAPQRRRTHIVESMESLAEVLGGEAVQSHLRAAGLRAADGEPLDEGVGATTALEVDDEQLSAALRQWATLALPTRSLAVVDVSGSMDFDAGGQTRMQLTTAATQAGLPLFPDVAALGLWAFSHQLEGEQDHRQLLPIRKLGDSVEGVEQRELLHRALESMGEITGGSTGLHDTTLAAYRAVLDGYDPEAINSVILFTDGTNEDPGSLSLEELLAQLAELADPSRPVRIVAIGISDDADADALEQIAAATSGQAYIARDPQDMAVVFRQALSAR